MTLNVRNIVLLIGVVLLVFGIYYALFVKGGMFSAELPKPVNVDLTSAPITNTQQYQANGEVLGESEISTNPNPLKDIYVNPFAN